MPRRPGPRSRTECVVSLSGQPVVLDRRFSVKPKLPMYRPLRRPFRRCASTAACLTNGRMLVSPYSSVSLVSAPFWYGWHDALWMLGNPCGWSGQTWAGCANERELSVVADDKDCSPGAVAGLRVHHRGFDRSSGCRHRPGQPTDRDLWRRLSNRWSRSFGFCSCHAQTATIEISRRCPSGQSRLDSPTF